MIRVEHITNRGIDSSMIWALLSLLAAPADASEGPWTTAPGLHNVYLGLIAEQFECFEAQGRSSKACGSGLPVSAPVARVGAKVFYRTGITSKMDVAMSVPVLSAFATSEVASPMFDTNTGVGLIHGRIRRRLGTAMGVETAVGAGVRSGALHRSTRGQITNLGEGTTDLLGTIYAGHTGVALSRFHTTSADFSYIYRLPAIAESDVGRIPGDELRVAAVSTFAVHPRVGLGVSADGSWRLWGADLDFSALGQYGDDRWAALAASQIKVGGRVVFYPSGRLPYLQISGMRAVWARNNPLDTTQIEVATGMDFGSRK